MEGAQGNSFSMCKNNHIHVCVVFLKTFFGLVVVMVMVLQCPNTDKITSHSKIVWLQCPNTDKITSHGTVVWLQCPNTDNITSHSRSSLVTVS